jgi:ferredoxin
MSLVSASDPGNPKKMKAKPDKGQCIGCGACLMGCITDALKLTPREQRLITLVNSVQY